MFRTKAVEKIKTHLLRSVTFFENRALYEIVWKGTVQPGRPQITIWRMRIAYWIPKSANTHSEYAILIAFPL
jgi:hypothetical protein